MKTGTSNLAKDKKTIKKYKKIPRVLLPILETFSIRFFIEIRKPQNVT